MTERKLSADEVVAMPLDELAMRVLEDARDTDGWHWRNWLGRAPVASTT